MKLLFLFLFAIITPFFVFLTEVLYGGTSPEMLKKGLAQTGVYKTISEFIINEKPEGPQDAASAEISVLIYNRFTPEYLQTKTEKLIDDAHVWITKDGPSPVLSFQEIKEDILTSNPEFQTYLDQIATAQEQQDFSGEASLEQFAGDPTTQDETNSLTALAQNDFNVPVGEYFSGIKTFYSLMKIIQPLIAILLIVFLVILYKSNDTLASRLRWIGTTFILAALFGFGMILFNTVAVTQLAEVTMSNSENFLAAFSPVMVKLMELFMKSYGQVQIIVSIVFASSGTLFVVLAKILTIRMIKGQKKSSL